MVSKLSIIAGYHLDEDNNDVTQDIKQQLLFLEDLDKMDKLEKKRYEEAEKQLSDNNKENEGTEEFTYLKSIF